MISPSISWITAEHVSFVLVRLQALYRSDPFVVMNQAPIEYVLNLAGVAPFYQDDVLFLAAVIIRTIICGHPLQDGNKRFGMLLGEHFLNLNSYELIDSNQDYRDVALRVARGQADLDDIYRWLLQNTRAAV